MSRWFRHYAGMARDEKLVRAAVKAKQPVERVVWVWSAILESAAEINDGGRYEFDAGEAAYFLRCDEPDLADILSCLSDLGRIADGVVARWGDRQYSSDSAAERQRRYRERKSGGDAGKRDDQRDSDAARDATPPSRDGAVTPQEAETELEADSDKTSPPAQAAEGARGLFDELWSVFPRNPSSSEAAAETAFLATKAADQPLILAAARRYAVWFVEDCAARDRTVDAGARYVPHLAKWIAEGKWRDAAKLPVKSDPSKPVKPMTRLSRIRDEALWRACERIMDKPASTSTDGWAFPSDIVAQARKELAR